MELPVPHHRLGGPLAVLAMAALLTACAAPRQPAQRAPVLDRTPVLSPGSGNTVSTPSTTQSAAADNAGKPGYYTVRSGDTLIRIGLETGQSWRDLQAWNGIVNPHLIEVGQVLRVVPPVGTSAAVAPPPTVAPNVSEVVAPTAQPVGTGTAQGRPLGEPAPASALPAPVPAPAPAAPPAKAQASVPAADAVAFIWPANGMVVDPYDETRNKGVGIGGKVGDPVLAAADGKVVYAGAGLRGYGNLIVLKHNNTYLTAYAHNQSLLVREDQTVRQGQKIAEMGSSDTDKVKLHFEVRRQGKPVDPLTFLPGR
jgi:lipoprotein NlpD